ncbi:MULTISPECIES: zinc metalloprotease HtpX [Caldilinea]|uniref:zinc metalloprotease HtpX n=1 Tax=Caldilinea TaxID=233191 RepID=UPI0002DC683C|nr:MULTISPECIES: zinc metalloprotease HtpX [Caldilinea]MBO9393664.1 zinc metalloprotease HtpX [Caldilinea sp.]GIV74382.1 MAG: protease HtpX [Caldilinea sp.]
MSRVWNTAKTTLLLATLTAFFVVIGGALGGSGGMVIALLFATAINMAAWWFSDKMALKMSGAREVTPEEAPELHRLVETLAKRAGIPKPRVHLIDSPTPNAFATGRSPSHGAVAATTGLLQMLNRDEIAGVMAHEIAHIKNRDTLISSIAATFAGAISMIADMAFWSAIFGGGDEEEGGGAGGFLMLFLAPIAALIIQLAISRSREFVADAEGARILGDPKPLADALRKLEAGVRQQPMQVSPATSHLYIVNPVFGGLASLFSTHPPTEKRIAKLEELRREFQPMAKTSTA